MAAGQMALAGRRVTVIEGRPSPARKLLMAGKSGLNLTKDEPAGRFQAAFDCPHLLPALAAFGPAEVMDWARSLGIDVFTGSSGRVFPVGMKASPLLRAWLGRLDAAGVTIRTRWRWEGWRDGALAFATAEGPQTLRPQTTVLALGGASWPRLGSDAAWVPWLRGRGVLVNDFRPANMGFLVVWSPYLKPHLGRPLKNVAFCAGSLRVRGEAVITAGGIEGGGIYAVASAGRDGIPLSIDLLPDLSARQIAQRLAGIRAGETLTNRLRRTLRLDPLKIALLQEWGRPLPQGGALAELVKSLPLRHDGPAPIDRAISSAGGVAWSSVTGDYELRSIPGTFVCGEMLDWEAPTGGYLITGCLATGRWAGTAAARH